MLTGVAQVTASQIRELQSFVLGVERNKVAVVAALTFPHNNGLVEGKVNKLKLIKRVGMAGQVLRGCVNVFSMPSKGH